MNSRGLVFVSCGQRSEEERELGRKICELVDATPNLTGYFAQNQSTLEGLIGNIFMRLESCVALIVVMHRRGRVVLPGSAFDRASVFIEQEIGVASFLRHAMKRPIEVRAYVEEGVALEGMREQIQLNPVRFSTAAEIIEDLERRLPGWTHLAPAPVGPLDIHLSLKKNFGRSPGGGRLEDLLTIELVNVSQVSVSEFALHVDIPKGFVDGPRNWTAFREGKSSEATDSFTFTEEQRPGKIRPGERSRPFEFRVSAEGLPAEAYEAVATVQVDGSPPVSKSMKLG